MKITLSREPLPGSKNQYSQIAKASDGEKTYTASGPTVMAAIGGLILLYGHLLGVEFEVQQGLDSEPAMEAPKEDGSLQSIESHES